MLQFKFIRNLNLNLNHTPGPTFLLLGWVTLVKHEAIPTVQGARQLQHY
jgi:hypothetical protein